MNSIRSKQQLADQKIAEPKAPAESSLSKELGGFVQSGRFELVSVPISKYPQLRSIVKNKMAACLCKGEKPSKDELLAALKSHPDLLSRALKEQLLTKM